MEDVKGFPLVGPLPPVHLSRDDRPPKPKGLPVSVSDLRARRSEINQVVLAGVRELPFSSDVYDITCEDAEAGFMRGPFSAGRFKPQRGHSHTPYPRQGTSIQGLAHTRRGSRHGKPFEPSDGPG